MTADFKLNPNELTRWHECMAGQGRPWEICRLLYAIRAVLDLSPDAADFLRAWKPDSIAKRFEITPLMVADNHRAAITYWKQWNAQAKIQSNPANSSPIINDTTKDDSPSGDEDDLLFHSRKNNTTAPFNTNPSTEPTAPPIPSAQPIQLPKFAIPFMAQSDVDAILTSLRFNKKLTDPDSRAHIANRAIALQQYLVNPLLKETARQILVHEITLMSMEDQLSKLSEKIERMGSNSDKLDSYTEEFRQTQNAYTKLTETYQKQLEKLGVEEIEKDNIKAHAIDTIGYITQAIRAYRANGDNTLIDGAFRADEVVWQLQPVKLRPSQYRPDIVIAIREAFDPANLFDPNFKPKGVTKKACDKLRKVIKTIDDEWGVSDNTIPEIEAPASTENETDSTESPESTQSADMPISDAPPINTIGAPPSPYASTPTPIPHFSLNSHNRDDDAMSLSQ